jgi:putative acetyltransferase
MRMMVRDETAGDIPAIGALITAAFRGAPHASGTEAAIVDALRAAGALSLSLVACDEAGDVQGHVACSPVLIDGRDTGWLGLGPLAVHPDHQRQGIGRDLLRAGLAHFGTAGAAGIVVLGDPAYYGRFGFAAHSGLRLPDVPAEYFLALGLKQSVPTGTVAYHPAFNVT